jgi:hypothetical protein
MQDEDTPAALQPPVPVSAVGSNTYPGCPARSDTDACGYRIVRQRQVQTAQAARGCLHTVQQVSQPELGMHRCWRAFRPKDPYSFLWDPAVWQTTLHDTLARRCRACTTRCPPGQGACCDWQISRRACRPRAASDTEHQARPLPVCWQYPLAHLPPHAAAHRHADAVVCPQEHARVRQRRCN